MTRRNLAFALVIATTYWVHGCARTGATVSRHERNPSPPATVVHVTPGAPAGHTCTPECNHYWDGVEFVELAPRHRHGQGCGHLWDGERWTVPAAQLRTVDTARAPGQSGDTDKGKAPPDPNHVHSASCGHVYDLQGKIWLDTPPGHVHARNCGHVYTRGKWCLPN